MNRIEDVVGWCMVMFDVGKIDMIKENKTVILKKESRE